MFNKKESALRYTICEQMDKLSCSKDHMNIEKLIININNYKSQYIDSDNKFWKMINSRYFKNNKFFIENIQEKLIEKCLYLNNYEIAVKIFEDTNLFDLFKNFIKNEDCNSLEKQLVLYKKDNIVLALLNKYKDHTHRFFELSIKEKNDALSLKIIQSAISKKMKMHEVTDTLSHHTELLLQRSTPEIVNWVLNDNSIEIVSGGGQINIQKIIKDSLKYDNWQLLFKMKDKGLITENIIASYFSHCSLGPNGSMINEKQMIQVSNELFGPETTDNIFIIACKGGKIKLIEEYLNTQNFNLNVLKNGYELISRFVLDQNNKLQYDSTMQSMENIMKKLSLKEKLEENISPEMNKNIKKIKL